MAYLSMNQNGSATLLGKRTGKLTVVKLTTNSVVLHEAAHKYSIGNRSSLFGGQKSSPAHMYIYNIVDKTSNGTLRVEEVVNYPVRWKNT